MREKSEALKCTHTHTRTVRAWHSVRRINGNKALMYVCHASPASASAAAAVDGIWQIFKN